MKRIFIYVKLDDVVCSIFHFFWSRQLGPWARDRTRGEGEQGHRGEKIDRRVASIKNCVAMLCCNRQGNISLQGWRSCFGGGLSTWKGRVPVQLFQSGNRQCSKWLCVVSMCGMHVPSTIATFIFSAMGRKVWHPRDRKSAVHKEGDRQANGSANGRIERTPLLGEWWWWWWWWRPRGPGRYIKNRAHFRA